MNESEQRVRVHSIETCGTLDGPGIRYVVFFQGCPLRCAFCHNRDTWEQSGGTEFTVPALMADMLNYQDYYRSSGGGVTATGGEPLLQPRPLAAFFRDCCNQGIHTALDTSGYASLNDDVQSVLEHTKLLLLDIKHIDDVVHRDLIGVSNLPILRFAENAAATNVAMWIRHVFVPGYSDRPGAIEGLVEFVANLLAKGAKIEKIEILPYHTMGVQKWHARGEPYRLSDVLVPSKSELQAAVAKFAGLPVPTEVAR